MKRNLTGFVLGLAGVFLITQLATPSFARNKKTPSIAPEFTHSSDSEWLNSAPLQLSEMRGQVVLVDFWTFDCWNCYHSFPWLNDLEERMANSDFRIIGVHTPEFEHEKIRDNIAAKIKEFDLKHPVMIDNDFSYWRAMGNRYWPAFYLIDKQGKVAASFVGETHKGDRQARAIEKAIGNLLAESNE